MGQHCEGRGKLLHRETHRGGARNQMVLSLVYVVTTESYPEESASNFISPDVAILLFCGKPDLDWSIHCTADTCEPLTHFN